MNAPHLVVVQPDGSVLLGGYCDEQCPGVTPCLLTVRRNPNGTVRLRLHGVERHSITLTRSQLAAIRVLLYGPDTTNPTTTERRTTATTPTRNTTGE